jgi:hypothetical protein
MRAVDCVTAEQLRNSNTTADGSPQNISQLQLAQPLSLKYTRSGLWHGARMDDNIYGIYNLKCK